MGSLAYVYYEVVGMTEDKRGRYYMSVIEIRETRDGVRYTWVGDWIIPGTYGEVHFK